MLHAASQRLQDDRVEVRTVACEWLTGMLRCLPQHHFDTFLAETQKSVDLAFPSRRRQRYVAGVKSSVAQVATPSTKMQHSCALSLSAILLSKPYDLETWTSAVLLALARAVRAPAPTRESARKALTAFRKYQQQVSSLPLRERLDPYVWDELQDASVTSSYFA